MADDPRWLDADQLASWVPFGAVLLAIPSALDVQLQRDAGLSFFSYLVLAGLSDAPDRTLRMSELAVLANGSLSRLSHTVAKLERAGWVRRRPLPDDRRVTLATLTDEGFAKLAAAAPGHVAEVRRLIVDVLDAEQFDQLGTIARTVIEALLGPDLAALRRRLDG